MRMVQAFFRFGLFFFVSLCPWGALAQESGGSSVLWTTEPKRIDRSTQALERIPDRRLSADYPDTMYVPKSVRVHDSTTFSIRDQRYRLKDLGPIPSQMVCRAADGSRWACGLRARMNLRALLAGQQIRCRKFEADLDKALTVDCQTSQGPTVSELLLRSGSVLALGAINTEMEAARTFGIETRAGIWSDVEYYDGNR